MKTINVLIIFVVTFFMACNKENFNQGSVQTAATPESVGADALPEKTAEIEDVNVADPEPASVVEVDAVVSECLSQWENNPFSLEQALTPVIYEVTQDKGNGDLIFKDDNQTEKPVLNFVVIDINVANQGIIDLNNPMGWYCLYFTGRIANNFSIYHVPNSKFATVSQNSQTANNFEIVEE